MSAKERRERERREMKAGILAVARDIAQEEGWGGVTIRKVAEGIEYSPPTIYEYFQNKDALLKELALEGFRTMYGMMEAAYNAVPTPEDRLRAVALAHWDFAWTHPDLYQVMHGLSGVPYQSAVPSEIVDVYMLVKSAAMPALGVGEESSEELRDAIDLLRSAIHGLVSHAMQDQLIGGRERGRQLVERAVHNLIASWPRA